MKVLIQRESIYYSFKTLNQIFGDSTQIKFLQECNGLQKLPLKSIITKHLGYKNANIKKLIVY
jgi:hypothetical protein